MTLIKLTIANPESNGLVVWHHSDDIRKVISGPQSSAVMVITGGVVETIIVHELADQIAAAINGTPEPTKGFAKKINKGNEQKQEAGE